MSQFAIKGHATRGKDVIQRLEMLGGVNVFKLEGAETQGFYYIFKDNNKIYYCWSTNAENVIVYTLEEFEEKFPYNVGDKVLAYVNNCIAKVTIQDIRWNYELNKVEYKICSSWLDASLIQYYKEETMEEKDEKSTNHVFDTEIISFDIAQRDKYELDLQGKFKIVLRKGKYYVERIKPQYPKTYEECCKIKQSDPKFYVDTHFYSDTLELLYKLLICRDAYWKIAGEQMGLGKPWKPDWSTESEVKYVIEVYRDNIRTNSQGYSNTTLSFPTVEMRNAFFENFKKEIEDCKELL